MMTNRRLGAVGVALAVATACTCSQLWGDADSKREQPVKNGSRVSADKNDRQFADNLAQSKFADKNVVTYQTKDGDTLFALQVKPKLEAGAPRACDYLLLVDTSASQVAGPLLAATQVAEELAKQAAAHDRIAIRTVNVPDASRDLTNGLQAPRSAAVLDAVKRLKDETPLGDTDLKLGIEKALGSFKNDRDCQQVVILLGDGMSIHNPITEADRRLLSEKMVQSRIGFFSVPMGPRLDPQNIHGFASATGGAVVRILPRDNIDAIVKRIQATVAAPIMYPKSFKMSATEVAEFYPSKLPPLRSDAPTLLVGRVKGTKTLTYEIEGTVNGKDVQVNTTENVVVPEADNYFLVGMVEQWKNAKDQPALMRADRALAFAQEINQLARDELLGQAQLALLMDKLEAAEKLFKQAQKVDPSDAEADGGLKVVSLLRDGKVTKDQLRKQAESKDGSALMIEKSTSKAGGKVEFRRDAMKNLIALAQEQQKKPGDAAAAAPPTDDDDLLKQQRLKQAVEEQRINQVVSDALRQARRLMQTDPDAAHDMLKRTLANLRDDLDLRESFRQSMLSRLEPALRNVTIEGARFRQDQDERLKILAMARGRAETDAARLAEQERTRERMRVFRNLMDQARYEEAYKQGLSILMDQVNEGHTVPVAVQAAAEMGLLAYHLKEERELVRVRQERFLATMLQVERSHIPFPDEPPIVFPPAAFWKEMSTMRKEKWESSGLVEDDPAALRKIKELKSKMTMPVTIDGFEPNTPLKDALGFISERYGLTILIDTQAFKDDLQINEPEQQPVKLPKMVNVSLGTVLRLLLAQAQGTFIIRRDYIEVTTPQRQAAEKTIRVYPVADLVVPIPNAVNQQIVNQTARNSILGFGGVGFVGGGLGALGALGGGLGALGGGLGALGALGGGLGALGGGLGALGGGLGALGGGLGALGGGLGALGAGGGGLPIGGMNGFGGVNGFGGAGPQGLGAGGQLGGQFGLQGGNQSDLLIQLITQVVGKPEDWAPYQPQSGVNSGVGANFGGGNMMGLPPVDPNEAAGDPNQAGALGYYPPAQALIVKATSRIHTRLGGGLLGPKGPPGGGPGARANDQPRDAIVIKPGDRQNSRLANAADKSKPKDKVAAKPKETQRKPTPEELAKIDAKKIWQDALAKGVDDPGLIIATADFLVEHGKFDHAAEFLKANLRNGIVVRPWVYDSLAIALKLSKGSIEDIERAQLSAVDMEPQDADGYLRASKVMAENKRWDRALVFCRQASLLDPNSPQPYAEALSYAEQGKDTAAMEWSASNLLSRDWPMENDQLHQKANYQVESLQRILQNERRRGDAEKMTASVGRHRQRDLAITISWQGSADLDLEVKEPIGTVCSFMQRQTTGGGTLVGDTLKDTSRESYIAAEAFSGDYEVTVRRIWGRPLGSKATLQVIEHQGTPQERIVLRETVVFDQSHSRKIALSNGRRTSVAQVSPNAAAPPRSDKETVLESSDTVLNKLRALSDPDMFGGGSRSGIRASAGAMGASRVDARGGRASPPVGQPAYQARVSPFVTNGVEMTYQPVVSSDRRVIGVTINPVFQTLSRAQTAASVVVNPSLPGGGELP